jgi:hypothetical protein
LCWALAAYSTKHTPKLSVPPFLIGLELDPIRLGRDAGQIAEEIVQHLTSLVGAQVTVILEIHADLSDGAPDHTVRTVIENAHTLGFKDFGFEES